MESVTRQFNNLPLWPQALGSIGLIALIYYALFHRGPPLPPGPKGRVPFLGMTFDMPKKTPWVTFQKWAEEYGPIMHARVGLTHYIYINSPELSREFLDKRSQIYSSRPRSVVGSIVTDNLRTVLMPYNTRWRETRRTFNNLLTAKKCDGYTKIQTREAIATLADIMNDPDRFERHLYRYSISVARSIGYGRRVVESEDDFAKDINKLMSNFSAAMTPGKYIVESIPMLRYLPIIFQPWMKELNPIREHEQSSNLRNYRQALKDAEMHPNRNCIALDLYQSRGKDAGIHELEDATTCNEILGTGSETTTSALLFTILALVSFPEAVKKAQEELDRVVGPDRFPTWGDEPNLPYIRAVVKESHRWRTVAPLGFRHCATQDDVWNGYRIPKGSVITINTWAMHMDAQRYPNPDTFQPERFLSYDLSASAYANAGNVPARDHFAYGNGKRICPGIHLAERSLFTITAHLLHMFDFKPALDAQGQEVTPDTHKFRTGLVGRPEPYKARFIARNEDIKKTLDRDWNILYGQGPVDSWDS